MRRVVAGLASSVVLLTSLTATTAAAEPLVVATGRVTTLDGYTPIRGIEVSFVKGSAKPVYVGTTDTFGEFTSGRLAEVPAGSGRLYFTDPSLEYSTESRPVTLRTGSNSLATTRMDLGAAISGTVTAPSGAKLSGMSVRFQSGYDESGKPTTFTGKTAADGVYVIKPIRPGWYQFFASDDPPESSRGDVFIGSRASVTHDIADVKAVPKVSATASVSQRTVTFKVTVSGRSNGLSRIGSGGRLTVYLGNQVFKTNIALPTSGAKTITVRNAPTGFGKFQIGFLGTQDLSPARSATLRVRVK